MTGCMATDDMLSTIHNELENNPDWRFDGFRLSGTVGYSRDDDGWMTAIHVPLSNGRTITITAEVEPK